MELNALFDAFRARGDAEALVWNDRSHTYARLAELWDDARDRLEREAIPEGAVTALCADFSPRAIALFLALAERRCILVPLTPATAPQHESFLELAQAEWRLDVDAEDRMSVLALGRTADHEHDRTLRERHEPGLVLFSSGSTGQSKGIVQNLAALLRRFTIMERPLRAISFLLYDHIGGINTMLYLLGCGGCLVTVSDRAPKAVLAAIEKHRVELLPTSPTFINLLLLSGDYETYDLHSLKLVTYGTEPMPESTLARFHHLFPDVRLKQTYGLSEVGILQSKSKSSDSLWVKLGGEGFQTRIVDHMLQIKADSAMLGYLNAPSPFTEDGWMMTGDLVETDGEYVRILGRQSEIINVGGQKVYPAEVESVILEVENVADATVFGEKNPIIGQLVCAEVRPARPEDEQTLIRRVKQHCGRRLESFKIPVRVTVSADVQHGARFKKLRAQRQGV